MLVLKKPAFVNWGSAGCRTGHHKKGLYKYANDSHPELN